MWMFLGSTHVVGWIRGRTSLWLRNEPALSAQLAATIWSRSLSEEDRFNITSLTAYIIVLPVRLIRYQ